MTIFSKESFFKGQFFLRRVFFKGQFFKGECPWCGCFLSTHLELWCSLESHKLLCHICFCHKQLCHLCFCRCIKPFPTFPQGRAHPFLEFAKHCALFLRQLNMFSIEKPHVKLKLKHSNIKLKLKFCPQLMHHFSPASEISILTSSHVSRHSNRQPSKVALL